jgi:hypothetical protein
VVQAEWKDDDLLTAIQPRLFASKIPTSVP